MSTRADVPSALALAAAVITFIGAGGCGRTGLDTTGDPRSELVPTGPLRPLPQTPDPVPPGPTLLRFAVIGDYGIDSEQEARVARMVASWHPDFVITTGDNNYPAGAASTIDANIGKHYAPFIGNYRGAYGPGSATNRFWPAPGNHDWDAGSLEPYLDYFTLPGKGRYYDVAIGPVHLYALDSDDREPDGNTEDSVQARWLEAALASSSSCFDIVYFHHPAYSSGPHGSAFNLRWPFESWGADVVFAGHDHVYERSRVGGIRHITIGVSGAEAYSFSARIPESEARVAGEHGALLATAREDGIWLQFFADDGSQLDSYLRYEQCPR